MSRQVLPILGAVVGAVVGFYAGVPVQGAQLGFVAGSIIGPIVDPIILQGNNVGDNQLQAAAEGGARAIVFGQGSITATCVIARGNRQVSKKREGGGKGGGPKTDNEYVSWTYAIGLGEAIVGGGILRIWQDEKLVYDVRIDGQRSEEDNVAFAATFRFYDGSESQLPDPDLQVFLGDDTPYFRGTAYVVFPNVDLTNTAERVPIYRFEVTQGAVLPVGPSVFVTNMDGGNGSTSIVDISSNEAVSQLYTTGDDRDETGSHIVTSGGPFDDGNCWRAAYSEVTGFSNRSVWFPSIPDYALPGDFTIEAWIKQEVYYGSANQYLICGQDGILASDAEPNWYLIFNSGGSGLAANYRFKSNELVASSGLAQVEGEVGTVDEWNHIEVSRDGTTLRIFINGTLADTKNDVSGSIGAHELTFLGIRDNGYGLPNQWLQTGDYLGPVRIVKGVALHTVDFTRPSGPFGSEVLIGTTTEKITLSSVIDSLLGRVDETADTSELDDEVRGVVIQETMNGADAISAVVAAYFADPVEVDGQLTFVKRGKPIQRVLTIDDLIEEPDVSSRENAIEYPAKLHFFFQSPTTGYASTKVTSNRYSPNVNVQGEGSVTVPVTFDDSDEPANIAAKLHKVMWNEAGGDFAWTVGDHCLDLVPTDVVGLSLRGVVNRARITATETDQGKIKLTMRKDRQSSYTADIQSIPLPTPTTPPTSVVSKAVLAVMDIPALVDADDDLYYYTAMSGSTGSWRGGQLQRSLDSGASWSAISEVTTDVIMGRLVATMTAASPHYPDNTNVIQVQLFDPANTLDDLTNEQWLSEQGALAVQAIDGSWEIIQYRDALDEGDGLYTLSMLQRGRLNTSAVAHAVTALVVVLDTGAQRQAAGSAWLSTVLKHRGVSYSTSPEAADIVTTTFVGNSQLEWPVDTFYAGYDGRFVIISQIVPRHRFGTEDIPVRSSNWLAYRATFIGSGGTLTTDFTDETGVTVDCGSIGVVTSVTLAQVNRITGAGPALAVAPGAPIVDVALMVGRGQLFATHADVAYVSFQRIFSGDSLYESADGGVEFTGTPYAGSPRWVFVSGGVFTLRSQLSDGSYACIGVSTLNNEAFQITGDLTDIATTSTRAGSISTGNMATEGKPRTTGDVFVRVAALGSDGTNFYLVGWYLTDGPSVPRVFSAGADMVLTEIGAITQAAGDPNTLTGDSGLLDNYALFPQFIQNVSINSRNLVKYGTRWFLSSNTAVYYNDDITDLDGWYRCPTGLGESTTSPTMQMLDVIQVGSTLLAFDGRTNMRGISKSTDGGETWTAVLGGGVINTGVLRNPVTLGSQGIVYDGATALILESPFTSVTTQGVVSTPAGYGIEYQFVSDGNIISGWTDGGIRYTTDGFNFNISGVA